MRALCIYAGPLARRHIAQNGLTPEAIGTMAGAAGGPKGLILGPLDRFIFGDWLPGTTQPLHLVGASIGAWRMATACLQQPVLAFERLERDYIAQHYELKPDEKRPSAQRVSELFGQNLQAFYAGRVSEVLLHPRYRLHIVTAHGRHLLAREQRWLTPAGYLAALLSNTLRRKALGYWLERVVFSTQEAALPFASDGYRTLQLRLTEANFSQALQASCSIPFVLQAVHDIAGAPPGAYWDGGLTDYHLHLNYSEAAPAAGLVLYPHFQKAVVPGWLDKHLLWRHKATPFLDNMVLLAPNPEWVKTLPNGKLPDRGDFMHYGQDLAGRVKAWRSAVRSSEQLAHEFEGWLRQPDAGQLLEL